MKKFFQYVRVLLSVGPMVIYYHFRYMIRFAKHPEKYPLEKRYAIARKEISRVVKSIGTNITLNNFDSFLKNDEKSLIISNHLSFFDPLILITKSEKPLTFVAKKEVLKYPFAGKVAKALDVFTLDRHNVMNQIGSIREIVSYLKDPNKPSVIIYIEGTRNRHPENECLDFHAGTLKIAQMSGVPLNVIATYGTFRILDMNEHLKPYPTSISFIERLDASYVKKCNTTELATYLKAKIDNEVDSLRRFDLVEMKKFNFSEEKYELETKVDARVKA